ncbi:MAG: hypothetical protein MJZ13_07815 [Bacteroidales bacterium]|nr:hypothetical protein [Bacteroidales bacterium]
MKNRIESNSLLAMFIAILCELSLPAQNIVKNPSFNDYIIPEPGMYETYPSLVANWNGYRYMSLYGSSFTYKAPIYNNGRHISDPSINGFRYFDLSSFEKGDSSYIIFCPLNLLGGVDYICGELEYCTQKGVEYELSFDYEIIKEKSDFALDHIYCALSGDYGYVTTNRGVRWFHYNRPQTIDLVKVELQTDTLGRHRAHTKFISNGGAGYITIGYLPDLGLLDKLREDVRRLGNRIKESDLEKLDFSIIPIHYIKKDSNKKNSNIKLTSNVHYLIDNVCISPLDSSVYHQKTPELENTSPCLDLNDEIEYNIKRQVHYLNINKQVYEFVSPSDSSIVESDTLLFDTEKFFANYMSSETFDIDDSLQCVVASRTLKIGYREPSCYNAPKDYFRVSYFGNDAQWVCRLEGEMLSVKTGNGKLFLMPESVVVDTTIAVTGRDLQDISKILKKHCSSDDSMTVNNSESEITCVGMVIDYKINENVNAIVVDQSILVGKKLRKSKDEWIHDLLKIYKRVAERNGIEVPWRLSE